MSELHRAGRSDKYGQVHVEKLGLTGFPDPDEPVALLRAQDEHALPALIGYLKRLETDPRVPAEQLASVRRQVAAFQRWRVEHVDLVRVPGVPPQARRRL